MEYSSLGTEISNMIDSLRNGLSGFGMSPKKESQAKPSATETKRAVLVLLKSQRSSGQQVIEALTNLSGGIWKPTENEIYPLLEQLTEEGLLEAAISKKVKVFTASAAADDWLATNPKPTSEQEQTQREPRVQPHGFIQAKSELAKASALIANAVAGIAISGTTEDLQAATDLLSKTSKSLFVMLGKDNERVD